MPKGTCPSGHSREGGNPGRGSGQYVVLKYALGSRFRGNDKVRCTSAPSLGHAQRDLPIRSFPRRRESRSWFWTVRSTEVRTGFPPSRERQSKVHVCAIARPCPKGLAHPVIPAKAGIQVVVLDSA